MPSIPVYAYYNPQYTAYKPNDLAAMYEKYTKINAKKAKTEKDKKSDFKELEGVGLANENRHTSRQLVGLRGQIEHLTNTGADDLLIEQVAQKYRMLAATELLENKNNKELYDKETTELLKQQGSGVMYFDPEVKAFFGMSTELDPETKKVLKQEYKYFKPEDLKKLNPETQQVNLFTFGEMQDKLANDDHFIRTPNLIRKLSYGMDLNHIVKEYVKPALEATKSTKIGGESTVGGFLDKKALTVVEEITKGGTTEQNFEQLDAATKALFTNLKSANGGKPWASLMSFAYQQPAREYVKQVNPKTKKTTVVLVEKKDEKGEVKIADTDEEAELNIKLYLISQSDAFKSYEKTSKSVEKFDFKSTWNLQHNGGQSIDPITSNISPIFAETLTWAQNDVDFTQLKGGKGEERIVAQVQTKDVPQAKQELRKNANILSKSQFTAGNLEGAQLANGKKIKDIKIKIEGGAHNAGSFLFMPYDKDGATTLDNMMYVSGKDLKLSRVIVNQRGEVASWKNFSQEDKNEFYKLTAKVKKQLKRSTLTGDEQAEVLSSVLGKKGYKLDLMYVTTGITHTKSINYAKPAEVYGQNLKNKDVTISTDDIDGFIQGLGNGDAKVGANMIDDDKKPEHFGAYTIYIPYNPLGANASGQQPGSLKYRDPNPIGAILEYDTKQIKTR